MVESNYNEIAMAEAAQKNLKSIDHYVLIESLGQGKFGEGFLAKDISNNEKVCIKLFKKQKTEREQEISEKNIQIEKSFNLKHENILNTISNGKGMLFKDGKAKAEQIYLVTELCENGELFNFVLDVEGL